MSASGCLRNDSVASEVDNTTPLSAEIIDHWPVGSAFEFKGNHVIVGKITNINADRIPMPSVTTTLITGERERVTLSILL
jgi:hypothetical protein